MTPNLGFGKPQAQPKPSKRSTERTKAAKQLDTMRADGVPEFEIYVRVRDKKPWYPVGAIAVKRSSRINDAIYANQEELLQGAFRLYPVLRKNQSNLEYGYRLKEFKDEPIQLAEPPKAAGVPVIQQAIANLSDRVTSLFKRI
jgi:hypothetical protein